MARDGRPMFACASTILGVLVSWPGHVSAGAAPPNDPAPRPSDIGGSCLVPAGVAPPGDNLSATVATTLAVQTALQQGREYLLRNNPKAAVEVLEGQLARINGNQSYLMLLRDAYRAYIRELRLAKQETLVQAYQQRLKILDPSAAADFTSAVGGAPAAPAAAARAVPSPAAAPPIKQAPVPSALAGKPAPLPAPAAPVVQAPVSKPATFRSKSEDVDPFNPKCPDKQTPARALLTRADEEFGQRKYREAGLLYAQAHQLETPLQAATRERWAYCKLHRVVEQLNQPPSVALSYPQLAAEARFALELAPRLDYGKQLLAEIEKRQLLVSSADVQPNGEASPEIIVQHGERTADGWWVADTVNFRVYHQQPRELAEQAAHSAERTRAEMLHRWFGMRGANWEPRCEIYLHATKEDYSRATNVHVSSQGHSTFRIENHRVLSRRIDLHCDDPDILSAALPHETTHAVLIGNFGAWTLPRWADEGIAVLSEPRAKVKKEHFDDLARHRHNGKLFPLSQLMRQNDYPEAHLIRVFFGQSVSLVDFLVKEKGPRVFTQFVRDGLRDGYEPALQRHYGYRSIADMEQRWIQFAFGAKESAEINRARP